MAAIEDMHTRDASRPIRERDGITAHVHRGAPIAEVRELIGSRLKRRAVCDG
jgi:hypothetical protein